SYLSLYYYILFLHDALLIVFVMFLSVLIMMFAVMPMITEASTEEYSKEELKEIQKMEEEMKFYFEVVGEFDEQGAYVIKDEELLLEKVAEGDQNAIDLYELSQLTSENEIPSYEMYGAASFGKCVVNKFAKSYGNVARQFLTGA